MSMIRWVALRVTVSSEGIKAGDVLGEVLAEDKAAAQRLAVGRYAAKDGDIAVVSKLSWDMSLEERARFDRRQRAHPGALNMRSGAQRSYTARKPSAKRGIAIKDDDGGDDT